MKGMKTVTAALLGTLLIAAVPASSQPPPSASPQPAAYRHYVACGLSQNAKPSHRCRKKRKKGAFFRSNERNVFYTVCVRFPSGKRICTDEPQEATQGTLYVNKITSNIPGKHKVTWFVEGRRVGRVFFLVVAKGPDRRRKGL